MRLKKALLGAAVALLGACGGKDGVQGPAGEKGADGAQGPAGDQGLPGMAGTPAATDGTRLKARWVTGSDGSKGFFGWLDSTLGKSCAFQETSAGLRCAPKADAVLPVWAPYAGDPGVGFLDAACSAPAIMVYVGDPAPAIGGVAWFSRDTAATSIGIVGAQVQAGDSIYAWSQAGPGAQCIFQMVAGAQFDAYVLDDVTSELVSGAVQP
jgi:hypothetical protein